MATTTVRISCPACHTITRTSEAVLWVAAGRPERTYVRFPCDTCRRQVTRPVDESIVDALRQSLPVVHIPLELLEPHPEGTAITYDDLLEFHFLLDDGEALTAAMATLTANYGESARALLADRTTR